MSRLLRGLLLLGLGCATTPAPVAAVDVAPKELRCPTAPPASAEWAPQRVFGARVEKVCLVGAGDETSLRLREAVAPREGLVLSAEGVRADLADLYRTELVSQASAYAELLPSKGLMLTYVVTERALVTSVLVEGAPSLPEEVRRSLQQTGVRDTPTQRERLVEQATTFYEGAGYPEATVNVEAVTPGVLKVQVSEGKRVLVNAVRFEGVKQVPEAELAKLVLTKRGAPMRQVVLDADVLQVTGLYLDRGLVMATVTTKQVPAADGNVDLVFVAQEGDLYRVGTVTVKGVALAPAVLKRLESKTGTVFSRAVIKRDLDRLSALEGMNGRYEVLPVTNVDASKKRINLTFEFEERKP